MDLFFERAANDKNFFYDIGKGLVVFFLALVALDSLVVIPLDHPELVDDKMRVLGFVAFFFCFWAFPYAFDKFFNDQRLEVK